MSLETWPAEIRGLYTRCNKKNLMPLTPFDLMFQIIA
jgi:hypothetical protein